MLTIFIACILSVVVLQKPRAKPHIDTPDAELRDVATAMKTQLSGWMVTAKDGPAETTINEYFAFLSQSNIGAGPLDSDHPYVEFIKRLPATAARPPEGGWTKEATARNLRVLSTQLEGVPNTDDNAASIDDCLRRIDTQMNYESWRKATRKSNEKLDRFAVTPDDHVLQFVERFRSGSALELASAADLMKPHLKRWGVELGDKPTPLRVLRAFFTTLQRPGGLEKCSAQDKGHAYLKFAERLPIAAMSLGWTCDNTEKLDVALTALLDNLHGSPEGKTTEGLVEAIVREMNYNDWVEQPGLIARKEGKPHSQELAEFVDRFRAK